MKKDKEWFVDKWTKERNKTDVHDPMYHFINEFISDVNQLDEPDEREQLETAYKDILNRGEFLFDDKRYVVVEKEPETIASVIVDFFKAAERLKEIGAIEVEELEE